MGAARLLYAELAAADDTTCDGIDDNCDGTADETFPEQGEACDGEDTDLCTDGATACEDGALICIDDPMGFAEDCNGIDDDCDGIEDNNLPSITADLVEGVCAGMEKVCMGVDGWAEPDYSQVPPYEVEEATCDGLDNDCNGSVDDVGDVDTDGYTACTGDCLTDWVGPWGRVASCCRISGEALTRSQCMPSSLMAIEDWVRGR